MNMVKRLGFSILLVAICAVIAHGRPQYRAVIDAMTPETQAEKDLQAQLQELGTSTKQCAACHPGKTKSERTEHATRIAESLKKAGLVNDDEEQPGEYKYDASKWRRVDGEYPAEAITALRKAINEAAKTAE